jgi:type IV fimbrial biogenesis protein FimT
MARIAAGFSLLELMFVITVAGIILGLAVPNMMQFAHNNRLSGAANDMLAAIHIARTEAIKRRIPTAVCFSKNPTADTPTCDGTGREGWVSWVDADNDFVVDALNEPVLARHEAVSDALTVMTFPAGNSAYFGYMPTGFLRPSATDITGLVICDKRGNVAPFSGAPSAARALLISNTGRPSITRVTATIAGTGLLDGSSCP